MKPINYYASNTIQTSDLPISLITKIKLIQSKIPIDILNDSQDDIHIRNGIVLDSHITILYGIDQKQIDNITDIWEKYKKKIIVNTKQLDHFDNETKQYTVYVLKCESENLIDFRNNLKDRIKDTSNDYFSIHISIAYINYGARLNFHIPNMSFDINRIEISKTNGKIQLI